MEEQEYKILNDNNQQNTAVDDIFYQNQQPIQRSSNNLTNTTMDIKDVYGTIQCLLKNIVVQYTNIFKHDEKSNKNKDAFLRNAERNKKLDLIPAFLDFCYIYYIHFHDDTVPIYRLPKSIERFSLIVNNIPSCSNNKCLNTQWKNIISNTTISDIRKDPPFKLRHGLLDSQIDDLIYIILQPICKDLLTELLKLKKLKIEL